jgi:cysteine desulfurase/selenocysteine lyase
LEQVTELVEKHSPDTKILIDGAQAAGRIPLDFSRLDIDFLAFSGHKMLGPMGSGGLLVKKQLVQSRAMKPWFFGGGMIEQVKLQQTEFSQDIRERFTPGTPDVAGAVGLAAACQYLNSLKVKEVLEHDQHLIRYALMRLSKLEPDIKLIGPTQAVTNERGLQRVGSVAFIPHFAQAHDVAQALNQEKIAVRSGYHCAQPLHDQQQWSPTVRISFSVYNSKSDVDRLLSALKKARDIFS